MHAGYDRWEKSISLRENERDSRGCEAYLDYMTLDLRMRVPYKGVGMRGWSEGFE